MPDKNDQQKAPAEISGQSAFDPLEAASLNEMLRGYLGDVVPADAEFILIASVGEHNMVLSASSAQHVEGVIEYLYRQLQDNREQQSAQERGRQGRLFH